MPIIKSAKKKLKQDKNKAKLNAKYILAYKNALKKLKKQKGVPSVLKEVHRHIDKALKKNLWHKNKANRLKSQASKLARSFSSQKQVKSK